MSYFDNLRMNFSGTFFTDPSTVNNVVENYDPSNWEPSKTQFYWNPMGRADFTFKDCAIKSIIDDNNSFNNDPILNQSISVIANPFPGKIVDLDPQQQTCSALYGVKILIGELDGDYVMGDFEPTSFKQMWWFRGGPSAVYQSSLINLVWNEGNSEYLKKLKEISSDQLSIRFTLDLYNGATLSYIVDDKNIITMQEKGVPKEVTDKIEVLGTYLNIIDKGKKVFYIATEAFFDLLLEKYLLEDEIASYGKQIKKISENKPKVSPTKLDLDGKTIDLIFTQGRIVGSIGPSQEGEPLKSSWNRVLEQNKKTITEKKPPILGITPFIIDNNKVKLDFSNSLPTTISSNSPLIDLKKLNGSLSFGYNDPETKEYKEIRKFDETELNNDLLMKNGGILEFHLEDEFMDAKNSQCIIKDGNGISILEENIEGYYVATDQIYLRMNPDNNHQERGSVQEFKIQVCQFGKPKSGIEVFAKSLESIETNKIFQVGKEDPNTGTPADSIVLNSLSSTTDANGIASFTVTATNPNNPRGYIDGQIYYIRYALDKADLNSNAPAFIPGINMYGVYVLVFDDTSMVEKPTWEKDIKPFMSQYGWLYPIMKQFDLGNYDVVTKYHQAILNAMTLPITDANHMPVTRDLSLSRLALFKQWIETGMAKS